MARSIRMLQYLHTVHDFIHIVHIMHLHSPHTERRHDSIAYLINLSSIHVSTAVYANFFQTFKFMRKLNANGFHRSESTENNHNQFFFSFVLLFEAWLLLKCLHGGMVFWSFGWLDEWMSFHGCRRKNENQNISWKKCEQKKKIELIRWYRCCDGKQNIFRINIVHFSTGFSFFTRPTIDCDRSHCVTTQTVIFFALVSMTHAANGEQQRRQQKGFSFVKHHSLFLSTFTSHIFCSLFRYGRVHSVRLQDFNSQIEYNEPIFFCWLSYLKCHSAFNVQQSIFFG